MRRFTEARYVPYLRTRYRPRRRWNAQVNTSVRDFGIFLRFVMFIAFLVVAVNGIGNHFKTAVENVGEYKVSELVNEYIDRGVLKATGAYRDKSFITVGRGGDGKVVSVETNTMEVNRFAAELSECILEEIKSREHEKIKIPLGAIKGGNSLLSSFGFTVSYRIVPAGKVTVIPGSELENAGINQTIHRLTMEVSVQVRVLFPFIKKEDEIKRNVLVSETVIVGEVPNYLPMRSY